jgi:hypothetical protein
MKGFSVSTGQAMRFASGPAPSAPMLLREAVTYALKVFDTFGS